MSRRCYVLSADRQTELVADYVGGLRALAISVKYGVGTTTVYRVLRLHGVEPEIRVKDRSRVGRPRHYPAEFGDKVIDLYKAGVSQCEIARKLSCSPATVRSWLKRLGVNLRPGLLNTPELVSNVLSLYSSGLSQHEIAKRVEISQPAVSRILRSNGVDTVNQSGANNPNWLGGSITSNGYTFQLVQPNDPFASMRNSLGYVAEHRLVVAKNLGRPLKRHETVHHINGNKTDNRLENLQLRQGQHGTGVKMVCRDCGSHNVEATELD